MALKPKLKDVPRIRGALRLYKVSAYITGILLLLLVLEMILKYTPIHREIYFGAAGGFVSLVPWDPSGLIHTQASGLNVSTAILIAHGWLYVLYLFTDFRLWSLMRWPFTRFIAIAAGGVIPFLSFIVEHFIARRTKAELAEIEQSAAAKAANVEVTN
ncbi:DUF3817 domain-containing protein [soil metagenome]